MLSAGDTALLTAGGAAVGALVGGFVAYMATRRQVTAMETEGERQRTATAAERAADRAHELALAREEREQQRKQDAYVHLMSYVIWVTEFVQARWVSLQVKVDTAAKAEYPKIDDSLRSLAVLMASEPVGKTLSILTNQLFAFSQAALRYEQTLPPGSVSLSVVTAERDAITTTATTLSGMLRAELGVSEP